MNQNAVTHTTTSQRHARAVRWVVVLVASALALAVVGVWTNMTVERLAKQKLANELQTILSADVAALTKGLDTDRANVEVWLERPEIHTDVLGLL